MSQLIGLLLSIIIGLFSLGILIYLFNKDEKPVLDIIISCSTIACAVLFVIYYSIRVYSPTSDALQKLIQSGVPFIENTNPPNNLYNVKLIKKKILIPYGCDVNYYEIQLFPQINH